jgi:hypothetical protein
MKTDAYFSTDRKHRYWLIRVWDDSLPIVANIGVNPSTADARENDQTIRKDIGFAERLGYGGLLKLNVGALRATDPRKWRKGWDRIGAENTAAHLVAYAQHFKAEKTIAAWGRNGHYAIGQCESIIREFGELWCFGKNPDGSPRHTLMLPYSTPLQLFTLEA